jgi:predicted nucleic acid-binding protein
MKVYLDTSIFDYYFDQGREGNLMISRLFEEIWNKDYQSYASSYVIDELKKSSEEKGIKTINILSDFKAIILQPNDFATQLAKYYIDTSIIPESYFTDALHIAISSVNNLGTILSFNRKYIVTKKTKIFTGFINDMFGYKKLDINSPI